MPTLTKTTITAGLWQGILSDVDGLPEVEVLHMGERVADLRVTPQGDTGDWLVEVPIPPDAISDGVQTFLINDTSTGTTLASFAILAGEALSDDIRAEIDLLRAELDMLKRAFRRHCLETG